LSYKGFTVWFTGLSCSGKSTLSNMLKQALLERGMKVELLDGDVVRQHLSKGLGFSKQDRDTNIRRIGFVCNLLSRNGVVAIAAAVSPYRDVRDAIRHEVGGFFEVYVKCPVKVLMERDTNGLYKKALNGQIRNVAGIDDPYEEPLRPEIVVETDKETPAESLQKIITALETLVLVPPIEAQAFFDPERGAIKRTS
jgi:adenylyl-sulfate kinase